MGTTCLMFRGILHNVALLLRAVYVRYSLLNLKSITWIFSEGWASKTPCLKMVTSDTGTLSLVLVCLSRNTEKEQNLLVLPILCPRLSASLLICLGLDYRVTRNRASAKSILIFSLHVISLEGKHSSYLGTLGSFMMQVWNYLGHFMGCHGMWSAVSESISSCAVRAEWWWYWN